VAATTQEYFDQQDAFTQWLASMSKCAAKDGTGAAALFSWFQDWCRSEGGGSGPSTQHAFAKALAERGIERKRDRTGTVWGLRYADTAELF
jgi:hypothetical protein